MDDNRVKLTGLWKNKAQDGKSYLAGSLGSARVLISPNGFRAKDTDPDYIVYLVPNRKKQDDTGAQRGEEGQGF
jgi:hypothetical protein